MENDLLYATDFGTPQGGIISPIYANMVLDRLEAAIKQATKGINKVNTVRYADDFIVTASSPEILEERVKPAVEAFLQQRGLSLSEEKTHVTHINTGFKFLGFNIRKYKEKLLIKPDKSNVKSVLSKIREVIKSNPTVKTEALIGKLNPIIRGWANYFRAVVSKRTFSYVDDQVYRAICRWINRRHPNKNNQWKQKRYFRTIDNNHWRFTAPSIDSKGRFKLYVLLKASSIPIKRHIKIRCDANPFLAEHESYFQRRESKSNTPRKDWEIPPAHFRA